MKIIKVENCFDCPYREYDNGGGFCEPFHTCSKSDFILLDDDTYFNMWSKIHPDCELENDS